MTDLAPFDMGIDGQRRARRGAVEDASPTRRGPVAQDMPQGTVRHERSLQPAAAPAALS